MTQQKVLIIKPGYSETLDPEVSGVVSLGDVLRTTVVLHLFPPDEYQVTWVTDAQAWPLLRGINRIHRVIKINPFTPFQLVRGYYDVVINLEKDPGICALADSIPGWRRYGFRFDPREDQAAGHARAEEAFGIANDPRLKQKLGRNWSEVLFQILGHSWQGENYILGHDPTGTPTHDIGVNYRVGAKYPLKIWPQENWAALTRRLEEAGLSVTMQPPQDNVDEIEKYIDWIASCRLLVTHDTLGLHLALALNKPVVALFGPTFESDIPDGDWSVKVRSPEAMDCQPCLAIRCLKDRPCMSALSVDEIEAATLGLVQRCRAANYW
jgi:heptosyltransferase-2